MAGESFLSPSYYLGAASQLGTQAVSGASGFLGGVANTGAGFLSSISQQPQYPTPVPPPSYTPPAPQSPTLSALSGRATGNFGTGIDTSSMFRSSPSPSQSSPVSAPDFLGMASGGLSAAGGFLGGLFNAPTPNVPPSYQGNVPTGGTINLPGASNVEALKSPSPTTKVSGFTLNERTPIKDLFNMTGDRLSGFLTPKNQPPVSGPVTPQDKTSGIQFAGTTTLPTKTQIPTDKASSFEVKGELAKPAESYLSSISGYTSKLGDDKTADLIKAGSAVATWTGSPEKVNIVDTRDALEFQRQQAIASGDTRAARYYANELDKAAQNDIRLSSQYHFEAKKTGVRQEANPYENLGDAALAFIKGGNTKDDFAKNYGFSSAVTGPTGVLSLLPGGRGTQERDWSAALKGKAAPDTIENFLPAIASWRAAGGTMGPYGSLGSRDQTGKFVPVPAENIAKMPEAFKLALADIGAGKTIRPTSTYVLPSAKVTETPTGGQLGGTFNPFATDKSTGVSVAPTKTQGGDIVKNINEGITSATGIGVSAQAAEGTDAGTIKFAQPTGAPTTTSPRYVEDKVFQQREKLINEGNTLLNKDLVETRNQYLASGGTILGADGKPITKFTKDNVAQNITYSEPTSDSQKAIINRMTSTEKAIGTKVDQATALEPLMTVAPVAGAAGAATTEKPGLWESANEWIGTNITKKFIPDYVAAGGAVIDTLQRGRGLGTTTELAGPGETPFAGSFKSISGADQIRAYLAGDKGIMVNVRDPTTGLMVQQQLKYGERPVVDVTGWLDIPQAAGARLMGGTVEPGKKFSDVVPVKIEPVTFINALWNMPREKPIEAAMYYGTPIGLGAGEAGLAWLGTKALASKAPTVVKIGELATQSTALPSLYKGGSYALMGQMGTTEVLKIPGYQADFLAPLSGKPIISRMITGYDENNQPIYAAQTAEATSARAGESAFNIAAMYAGGKTAGGIRYKSTSQLPARENLGIVEKGERQLSKVLDVAFTPSQWKNAPAILKTPLPEGVALSGAKPIAETKAIDITRIEQPAPTMEATFTGMSEAGIRGKGGLVRSTGTREGEAVIPGTPVKGLSEIGVGTRDASGKIDLPTVTEKASTKDLDIILETGRGVPEKQLQTLANSNAKVVEANLRQSGMTDAEVTAVPIYKDQWGMFNTKLTKLIGEKNPESFTGYRYRIKGTDTLTGIKTDTQIDSLIAADVKIATPLNPIGPGGSRVGWWGMVREPASVGSVPMQGLGSALFGRPSLKRESEVSEYYNVKVMGANEELPITIKVPSTSVSARDDVDAFQSVLQSGTQGGKYWNEHVPEVGKVALKLQIRSNVVQANVKGDIAKVNSDLLAGKITPKEATSQLKVLNRQQEQANKFADYVNNDVLGAEFYGRMTPTGKVEKINVREQAQLYAQKNADKLDELLFPSIKPQIKSQPPTKPSTPPTVPKSVQPSSTTHVSSLGGGSLSSGLVSSLTSKIVPPSVVSVSSKVSSGPKPPSAPPSSGPSSLPISVGSISGPSPGSKGSGGSKVSGSSSLSASSLYGSSSPYSSGSPSVSSISSGSSSSTMSPVSRYSGSAFGTPFLAPPGGGGGGGGGRGRGNIVVKNPLSALRVASGKAFKNMFDFTVPNKLAADVSKNLKQTQPYGTEGASGAYIHGASESIKEATGAMRKPKKSSPKLTLSNTNMKMPKISIPEMHLETSSKKKGKR